MFTVRVEGPTAYQPSTACDALARELAVRFSLVFSTGPVPVDGPIEDAVAEFNRGRDGSYPAGRRISIEKVRTFISMLSGTAPAALEPLHGTAVDLADPDLNLYERGLTGVRALKRGFTLIVDGGRVAIASETVYEDIEDWVASAASELREEDRRAGGGQASGDARQRAMVAMRLRALHDATREAIRRYSSSVLPPDRRRFRLDDLTALERMCAGRLAASREAAPLPVQAVGR